MDQLKRGKKGQRRFRSRKVRAQTNGCEPVGQLPADPPTQEILTSYLYQMLREDNQYFERLESLLVNEDVSTYPAHELIVQELMDKRTSYLWEGVKQSPLADLDCIMELSDKLDFDLINEAVIKLNQKIYEEHEMTSWYTIIQVLEAMVEIGGEILNKHGLEPLDQLVKTFTSWIQNKDVLGENKSAEDWVKQNGGWNALISCEQSSLVQPANEQPSRLETTQQVDPVSLENGTFPEKEETDLPMDVFDIEVQDSFDNQEEMSTEETIEPTSFTSKDYFARYRRNDKCGNCSRRKQISKAQMLLCQCNKYICMFPDCYFYATNEEMIRDHTEICHWLIWRRRNATNRCVCGHPKTLTANPKKCFTRCPNPSCGYLYCNSKNCDMESKEFSSIVTHFNRTHTNLGIQKFYICGTCWKELKPRGGCSLNAQCSCGIYWCLIHSCVMEGTREAILEHQILEHSM